MLPSIPLVAESLVVSVCPVVSDPAAPSLRPSPSRVNPAYAALGELAAVLDISGVGERLTRRSCVSRCEGIGRGGDGDEVLKSCEAVRE